MVIDRIFANTNIPNIYIYSDDNEINYTYSQYILNFLANNLDGNTNTLIDINNLPYIIYNYQYPTGYPNGYEINSQIFIDNSFIKINNAQYLNNWISGRKYSNNFEYIDNSFSSFNNEIYYINNTQKYKPEPNLTGILIGHVDSALFHYRNYGFECNGNYINEDTIIECLCITINNGDCPFE